MHTEKSQYGYSIGVQCTVNCIYAHTIGVQCTLSFCSPIALATAIYIASHSAYSYSSQLNMKLHCSGMACLFMDYLFCLMICSFMLVNASIERDDLEGNRKIWSQSIPNATGKYPCGVDKIGVVKTIIILKSVLVTAFIGTRTLRNL